MNKKTSAFGTWFKMQAGNPPEGDYLEAKEAVFDARWKLEQAEALFKAHREYELKRTYALYAWCARDKK